MLTYEKWFQQSVNILSELLRNPGKATFGNQNRKIFPGEACLSTPLEAYAFGACLGNRSGFILDQCPNITVRVGQLKSSPLF